MDLKSIGNTYWKKMYATLEIQLKKVKVQLFRQLKAQILYIQPFNI